MSTRTLVDIFRLGGKANWWGQNYWNFVVEAYAKNVIAYHCITQIAKACANIPLQIKVDGKVVENHPVLKLLKRPNPLQGWKTFMRDAVTARLISGNCYIWGNVVSTGKIMELTLMRPDRVNILTSSDSEPYKYIYTFNNRVWEYPIDPITQYSEVLHIKEPNPLNDLYGMSPIAAASMSIDQHNESSEWNKKLLENSARPPGIITMKDKSDNAPQLTKEQLENLRDMVNEKISGSRNAGKIPLLNFDMVWQNLGMSPTDMDWLNGRIASSRDICYAFNFPPHLLGLPDSSTYNNMSEAKLALYEETVIPLIENFLEELSNYINIHSGLNIEIVPELDKVSALIPRRESIRASVRQDLTAGFISINEARTETGKEPVPNGDQIFVPTGRLPLDFATQPTSGTDDNDDDDEMNEDEGEGESTPNDPAKTEGIDKSEYQDYLLKKVSKTKNVKKLIQIAYS